MAVKEKLYLLPRYGDGLILLYTINWKGWKDLERGITHKYHYTFLGFIMSLFWMLALFGSEMFANSIRVFTRRKFGKNAHGIILVAFTAFMILAFNHRDIPSFFAAQAAFFGLFSFPIAAYFMEWEELFALTWRPASSPLMIFMFAYLFMGTVHVMGMYFLGWVQDKAHYKKGISRFYDLFSRKLFTIGEPFYQIVYEPALVFLIGGVLYTKGIDDVFGLYLITASICLFVQEFIDWLPRAVS